MFGFGSHRKTEAPRLDAVFVSETGLVRAENQDNVLVSLGHGVFCVADGVGGCLDGARASATVCHEVRMMIHAAGDDFAARVAAVRRGLTDANDVLYARAEGDDDKRVGSTAAVLVFDLADAARAAVVHVGDSRVYRVRHGLCELITHDHRVLGGNTLTRAVGAAPSLRPDVEEIGVARGDRFVLCTDGVSSVVSDARIALFASGSTLEASATRLAGEVVKNGAPDNYTFILVEA